jgi:hypothetical protein
MPTVGSEMYDIGGRKYIDIDGLTIKVPWRYNRVTGVTIKGLTTLQELKKGDTLKSFAFETKKWNNETFYVLKEIDTE